jgi:hypothetical protein
MSVTFLSSPESGLASAASTTLSLKDAHRLPLRPIYFLTPES